MQLAAVDHLAQGLGLRAGMNLADARALVPELASATSDPAGDAAALNRLADWCGRFSPWVASDGDDGLMLDITGVAHLFGGENGLLHQLHQALARLRLQCRSAIADTPAAAWAWARYSRQQDKAILSAGAGLEQLGALPVAALQLDPALLPALAALGLHDITVLAALPRAPLARRFGPAPGERLDALLGRQPAPISPRTAPLPWRSRLDLAEPLLTRDAIDLALRHLLDRLCARLEQAGLGARQLHLHAYRVDGESQSLSIGTAQANRDAAHLFRLFRDRLDQLDPGFGIDCFILEAGATDPFSTAQAMLEHNRQASGAGFAQLVDRLRARLGPQAVFRLQPRDSHWPEQAMQRAAPFGSRIAAEVERYRPRPALLLARPEPVEFSPDGTAFRWHRVLRRLRQQSGPERLSAEWWRHEPQAGERDYFRMEDEQGRRYWLFRSAEGWFLHGLFP